VTSAVLLKKSEQTRQRILDAAATLLAARGYAGTSIKAIAEEIGMQDASLYYYFPSKEALVLEVLHVGTSEAEDAVATAVAAIDANAEPLEALRLAIVAHAKSVLGMGDYPRANVRNFGQLPAEIRSEHQAEQARYGRTWKALIARAMSAGVIRTDLDPSVVRMLILGAMNWGPEWFKTEGALSSDRVGEQMASLVMEGLVPRQERGHPAKAKND
jgi:AcrR family transcriptional regulator